jgi:hypothetical protein
VSETYTIATWDVLKYLGFQPDKSGGFSDVDGPMNYDFGNFKLTAACVMNLSFVEVVMFTGVMRTSRTLGEVVFEMPRSVPSREFCTAWITWKLDKSVDGAFQPARETPWLQEGRTFRSLLPWEIERERREQQHLADLARPYCLPHPDWLKLALKTLANYAAQAEESDLVEIGFDGKVLTFRIAGHSVALAAEGNPWKSRYTLPAGQFRVVPRRRRRASSEVSPDVGCMCIAGHPYDGMIELIQQSGQDS